MKLADGAFLMRHEHLAGALVELSESAKTSSRPKRILPRAPEAFERVAVMSTGCREQMALKATCVVGQRGGECRRPMAPAAIDDQHDLFAGMAQDTHDLMAILAQFLGINMRPALREET